MSEQNISNSIDVFMDILNLVFQGYLKHWRENQEIDLIQAQMDTVSNHVSVMAYEFHPLEHTFHSVMESIQNNKYIDLDFVKLADKYTTFRNGEELIAKALAEQLNGKKLDWLEFGKIINDVKENPLQLILDYLKKSNEFDKLDDFIKDAVLNNDLNEQEVIKLYLLDDEDKVALSVQSQNSLTKLKENLKSYKDPILMDPNTSLFVNDLHKLYEDEIGKITDDPAVINNVLEGNLKDIRLNKKDVSDHLSDFNGVFRDKFTKSFLENYYKLDENGELLSLEQRRAKKEAYEKLLTKPYEELTAADRQQLCYFQFAVDEDSPLATLSREMSSAVILQNTAFLKNVKHGELYNKFTGDSFTIKYDINGQQYIDGPIKNDLSSSGIRKKAVDEFVASVKGVFEHAESQIQSVARRQGNLDDLAGMNLVEFLKEISKDMPDGQRVETGFVWEDHHKVEFISRMRDLQHNLSSLDFKSIVLGFEDKTSSDRKWVVPYDMMLDDVKGVQGRMDALYSSFKNNALFMMKMWDLDTSAYPNMPQNIKDDFDISRSWATFEYLDSEMNADWLELKLNSPIISDNFKTLLVGYAINQIGDDVNREYGDVLYKFGIDVSDKNSVSEYTGFYKKTETDYFKAKDLFTNFDRE